MSDIAKARREGRIRRHRRVRKKVHGTAARPRLAVYRSNKHISVQLIDDVAGRTVAAASTIEADQRSGLLHRLPLAIRKPVQSVFQCADPVRPHHLRGDTERAIRELWQVGHICRDPPSPPAAQPVGAQIGCDTV